MTFKKQAAAIACAALSALVMTLPASAAFDLQNPSSSKSSRDNPRTITGAWRTVVTPENCQTGEPFTPLAGLFTFNDGGTMSEFGIGPGQSPALRSPGHGVWAREHGWRQYSFAFTYYRYSALGIFIGSQRVSGSLMLGWSGDDFATRSVIEVLDVAGNLIGSGCATAAGSRFE
jgi:hypothetical protein